MNILIQPEIYHYIKTILLGQTEHLVQVKKYEELSELYNLNLSSYELLIINSKMINLKELEDFSKLIPILVVSDSIVCDSIFSKEPISIPLKSINSLSLCNFIQLSMEKFKFASIFEKTITKQGNKVNNFSKIPLGMYEFNSEGNWLNDNSEFSELVGAELS